MHTLDLEKLLGLHKKYKVYPDIAIFGKSLGNGYAINAILGTRKVMSCAEQTFLSSTFLERKIRTKRSFKNIRDYGKNKILETYNKERKLY